MTVVLTAAVGDPTPLWELWDSVEIPPPLCMDFQRPDKKTAVAEHSSRFVKE